jgi:hypothetical protein
MWKEIVRVGVACMLRAFPYPVFACGLSVSGAMLSVLQSS